MTDIDVSRSTPPRPVFDAELVPGLEAVRSLIPALTVEGLPELRRRFSDGMPGVPAQDLTAAGMVTVEEREVPGPPGGPSVTLLILRPCGVTAPLPGIYHVHGGGM